jgi:5-methylcytosine-specific restriction enzyme A
LSFIVGVRGFVKQRGNRSNMALCKDCNNPAIEGEKYCAMHMKFADQRRPIKPRAEQVRPMYAGAERPNEAFYHTTEWRTMSKCWIKAHPECANCGAVEDLVCDHIIPPHGDPELQRDRNNLQTLCRSCSAKKTAREVSDRRRGL